MDGMSVTDPGSWLDLTLTSIEPLRPQNAVAGLLVMDDGRYVMQLRDALPNIYYPMHWGCFGGAVDPGETALGAFKREIREELCWELREATEFTRFDFDFSAHGHPKVFRIYFVVRVSESDFARFQLREGSAYEAVPGNTLLTSRRVTPYDAFAIWMHMSAARLSAR